MGYRPGQIMALASLLKPDCTLVPDPLAPGWSSRDEALRTISLHASRTLLAGVDPDFMLGLLVSREVKSPTAVPEGVAFPHAIDDRIPETTLIVARTPVPVSFGTPTRVDLIFTIFGSSAEPWRHVRLLARLARICRAPGALGRLRGAADAGSLRGLLLTEDESHD